MNEKIKKFILTLNEKGIPLPMLRDPFTKIPSVSLTMLVISFNIVLFGLIGKSAKMLDGVDLQQAIYWFGICAGLYFGRKISSTSDGNITQTKEEGRE